MGGINGNGKNKIKNIFLIYKNYTRERERNDKTNVAKC